jgi:putative ABC transport system permease protein
MSEAFSSRVSTPKTTKRPISFRVLGLGVTSFFRLLGLFSWHYYKKSIWKGGVAVLGIALGVAVLFSMNAATFSAFEQFKQGVNQIAGTTTFEVKSENAPLMKEEVLRPIYDTLEKAPQTHYTQVHPVLELPGLLLRRNEKGVLASTGQVLNMLGVDTFNDASHREIDWVEEPVFTGLNSPLQEGSIAISDALAQQYALHRGSGFPVLLQERIVTLKVIGIFKVSGRNQALRNVGFSDISVLQDLSHTTGLLSRIELDFSTLKADEQNRLKSSLEAVIPHDLNIRTPQERSANLGEMVKAYQVNLMALSFITLIVAAFLIYNTLSMAVLQRRQEIGTYRLLGLSAKTLSIFIQLEALCLGGMGSLIGLLLGSQVLPMVGQAVSQTLQNVYTGQATATFTPPDWLPWVCVLVGLFTSFIGAYFPVQEALQIQPIDCIRPLSESANQAGRRNKLAKMGVLLLILALGFSLLPPLYHLPLGGYLAAFCILAGGTLLTPILLSYVLWALQQWSSTIHLPIWARLCISLLQGGMHRSAVAVASLLVALALSISLTTLIGSFRHSVEDWIHQSLRADIFIQPQSATSNRSVGLLSFHTVQALRQDPAIEAGDPFLEQAFTYQGQPFYLGAANLDTFARYASLTFTHGQASSEVLQQTWRESRPLNVHRKEPFPTIISEPFSTKHQLKKGDTFTLNMPKGPLHLKVQGVYYDYASSLGYAIIHRGVYQAFGGTQADASTSLALYLKPNEDPERVIQRLEKKVPQGVILAMRSNKALREEVLGIFDKTFAITYLMQGVALLISILTVLHALTALILDGKRIYATLDYLGMSQALRLRLVMNQGVLLSLLGYGMAFVFGMMLASVLIYVLNAQSFGWSVPMQTPWAFLGTNILWVLGAGVFASLVPMWFLRQQVSTSTLRYE